MSATYAPATATERRVSLSRGPALVAGTILLAAGLYSMYRQHTYPHWANFPNGNAPVDRHILGIFGVNGFTGLLTAVAGGLLLFGAAEHYLAKTMSLIVGGVLGAAAIIAAISGNVLGLAAANGWTEIAWGIAAAILIINALIPAHRRGVRTTEAVAAGAGAGVAAGEVAGHRRRERVAAAEDPNAARTGAAAGSNPAGGNDTNYTRRITGSGNAAQTGDGAGEPVGVGGGNASNQEQPVGAGSGGSGGGRLSRFFGRRA